MNYQPKICKFCGKTFIPTNPKQEYCKEQHYQQCVICGKMFEVFPGQGWEIKKTCSRKCSSELRKRTNIDKYGSISPSGNSEIQKKMKKTSLERYGEEHPQRSDIVKEKMRKTNLERRGVEYSFQDPLVQEKYKETMMEKYGVEYPLQSSEIKEKTERTNLSKYGEKYPLQSKEYRDEIGYVSPFQNQEVQKKIEETNLEKYGVNRPLQNFDIKEKADQTCVDRYGYDFAHIRNNEDIDSKYRETSLEHFGVDNPSKSIDIKEKIIETNRERYVSDYFSVFEGWKPLSKDYIESLKFNMEKEVKDFLLEIDPDMDIRQNVRNVIPPKELDFYLPQYQLAIECNPTVTHNSTHNFFTGEQSDIYPAYHLEKTNMCEDKGIFLFHIFGPEWTYKKDIIKSMLRNILGKTENKYFARKLEVREVSHKDSTLFLDQNHRQGSVNCSVRLGLFDGYELISLMTFGKIRPGIGSYDSDFYDTWELIRFCSKLNTTVVGGASKLLKHFIDKYHPKKIRSFSDRAHTKGIVYQNLGFEKLRTSDPGYVWVDYKTDMAYNRINAQRSNIQSFLNDNNIDFNKSESQIMEEHGFLQLFDCGTILWEKIC